MRDVLKLLQDGEFHSGEALGAVLGVSRAAVWKRLQYLEAELGLVIHRVRGRGYCLASPIKPLDAEALSEGLSSVGWRLALVESLDSTNAEVLRRLSMGEVAPLLVLAEAQSSGRGRRGRSWASPYAENLYYSLGLRVEGSAYPLEGLSLSVGLAVLAALRESGCVAVGLKWPNDLLVNGRKIAGVLLELSGDPAGSCQVVIGIGVNANMLPGRAEIDQPWTSLRQELGGLADRTALALSLSRWLLHYLDIHKVLGFAALREEWEASHLWQGREVCLSAGARQVEGVVLGVDQQGAVRLNVAGEERSFSGGELSLRLRNDS